MGPNLEYKNDINNLVNELNRHTKLYDEGYPEISDEEWDRMYFKLQDLERRYEYYLENSPTQRINYQVMNKLNKVEHNHPMLSLDKTKDLEEIKNFLGSNAWIAMLKMDGLTCSLRYINGKLVSAETRGNGIVGEDILHNALQIKSIPNKIPFKGELIIDGEIICKLDDFEKVGQGYKNSRNFASGSIRLLDSKECASRCLTFIPWDVIKGFEDCDTLSEKIERLFALSFLPIPCFNNAEIELEKVVETLVKTASKLNYPIDGLVFKYDNVKKYDSMGKTDHHFKGGLAYKFYDELASTQIIDIEWTMGRTGILTPVAILEPVELEGTTVSRASLHNISIMEDLLGTMGHQNQKVEIFKANMIIPQIKNADTEVKGILYYMENPPFEIPSKCPVCGGNTEIKKEVDSKVLYCSNPSCEGKLINKIDHFFGKKGLDAKGLSNSTIEKLIERGWVSSIRDVFCLDQYEKEWKSLPGFGEKSVNNILKSIRDSRTCIFESVISGAGIPLIGRTCARDIATWFQNYQEFRQAIKNGYDFTQHPGYGYELNKALHNYNYDELDYIVENYLIIENKNNIQSNKILEGLNFCITGKLKTFKNRDELSKIILNLGGKVVGSVSKNTNYLINNDVESSSAKNKKAKELDIKIIDEQTFMTMFDLKK